MTDSTVTIDPLGWVFGSAQSIGRHRDHNEDALFTYGSHLAYQNARSFAGLFIVADGMGGHADGELASSRAIQVFTSQVLSKLVEAQLSEQSDADISFFKKAMFDGIQNANQLVKKQVPGGGTTLTAMLIYQNNLLVAHVGDSRACWITPKKEFRVLTRDHSFVRQLVELGQITEEEAAVHPQRNILSMALGQWEPLEPDIQVKDIPSGGHLLICSDGLWGVVPEATIGQIIHATTDTQLACQELIDSANQSGGPDNISVILIRIPGTL